MTQILTGPTIGCKRPYFSFFVLLNYPISSRIKHVVMFRHFKIPIKRTQPRHQNTIISTPVDVPDRNRDDIFANICQFWLPYEWHPTTGCKRPYFWFFVLLNYPISSRIKHVVIFRHFKIPIKRTQPRRQNTIISTPVDFPDQNRNYIFANICQFWLPYIRIIGTYIWHTVWGGGHVGGTPHGVTDHIFDFFLLKYPISSRIKNVVMFRHFKIYIKTL